MKDCTIITCSYNTPDVIKIMLQSFIFHHPDGKHKIIICENSTNELTSSWLTEKGIKHLRFPGGTHAKTLDKAFDVCTTQYALVVDTDIIFNENIGDILKAIKEGEISLFGTGCGDRGGFKLYPRIHPWFMFVNMHNIRKHNIKFYDQVRVARSKSEGFYNNIPIQGNIDNNRFYDVGSTFYEDVYNAKLKIHALAKEPGYYWHAEGMSWHRQSNHAGFMAVGNNTYNIWHNAALKYSCVDIAGKFEGIV